MTRNRHQEITEARKLLELQEKADLKTIKSSYRGHVSKWHPDTALKI